MAVGSGATLDLAIRPCSLMQCSDFCARFYGPSLQHGSRGLRKRVFDWVHGQTNVDRRGAAVLVGICASADFSGLSIEIIFALIN